MDDLGFKKIDVTKNTQSSKVAPTPTRDTMTSKRKKRFFKSKWFSIIVVLLVVLGLFGVYSGIRASLIVKDAKAAQAQAKVAYAAIKQNNIILAKDEFVKTQEKIKVLKKDVDGSSLFGFVPFINAYYHDGQHMVNAAGYGVDAGIVATDSIIPYADVLGLKGQGTFTMGSAEDRIRLAVKTLGKVVPKMDQIEAQVAKAKEEVDQVNPNRYPNFSVFKKVRDQIYNAKALIDSGSAAVAQGKPLIKQLPDLLGESGGKKYLILFQNNAEQRPTGGFLTYYAIFRVEEGVIKIDSASDIYDLDNSIRTRPAVPEIITKYLPKVNQFFIRDSNLSPDFQVSMKTFRDMYDDSSIKQNVDGIIAIDLNMLVDTIRILGDVQVDGFTFNANNDARCNCPQVVYVLEDNISRPVNYIKTNRKGLVGDLLLAIMQKALKSSPRQYWGPLFQQGMKNIAEKDVLFSLNNAEAQKGIDSLNWGGVINQSSEGNYLHINDANFGGQKSNLFVKQSVRVDLDRDSSGQVKQTLSLTYKNPQAYSDCNLESGGLCLNATLRNFQRVYVPKGSTLVSSKGSEVKVTTNQDLGRTDFEGFFRVNPQGKSSITYSYTLPFKVNGGTAMPFLIQKQPGTDNNAYEIYANGRKVESFNLETDKQLSIQF